MPSVVLCFHVHLPLGLRKYSFFDIGRVHEYVDEAGNRLILDRVARDCYLPANRVILKLIRSTRGRFKVAYSISGMLLEQLEREQKSALESFRRLADTGCVELVSEPYHHSLASLFSVREFREQASLHRRRVRALFGQEPRSFRNTELLYDNDVARIAESMGFRVILAGGAGRLPGCDETALYRPAASRKLTVLFRHDRLSDGIALRDAGGAGNGQALSADGFARRLAGGYQGEEVVNLFVDYETIGGRTPGETGILDFLEGFPGALLKYRNWRFLTPSGAAAEHEPRGSIDAPGHILQAGSERDGFARLENHLQRDAAHTLYAMEDRVREAAKRKLSGAWRNLQASDHFCAMSTKGLSDGAVHRHVNPFPSPYDAYISYMNILKDFSGRIAGKTGVRS